MLAADIPIHKLENSTLKQFLEKWTKQSTPAPVTLRSSYVKTLYENKLDFIRKSVGEKSIWISIDETTDIVGRYVAHTIVGTLDTSESTSFLLHAECLEKTNGSTIAQVFMNSLSILWPESIHHERVLLFTTNAAAYMLKAGSALKVLFPRMMHVTCATHGLHRVAEEVRSLFVDVDKLVANGKKIFLKSAARCTVFREMASDKPLPPQPVLTRWGSWIVAAVYYAEHFDVFASVVDALDGSDAMSIRIVQELSKKTSLQADLAFIRAHFGSLPAAIEKLEKQGRTLTESTSILSEVLEDLRRTPGNTGKKVRAKIDSVLSRNPTYRDLEQIANVLRGRPNPDADQMYSPGELASFRYAPITSVDVERSFSTLKHVLNDRRLNFTFESLKQILVVNCNQ